MEHVQQTENVPLRTEGAMFRYSLAMAINRVTPPPTVVTVRSYAGETEAEAVARCGEANGSNQKVIFVHI